MISLKTFLFVSAVLSAFALKAQIEVYPDGDICRNPRVPFVSPVPGEGAKGSKALRGIDYPFTYKLLPSLSFPNGGSASLFLRDSMRREEKRIISFRQGQYELRVLVGKAFGGRIPELAFFESDKL